MHHPASATTKTARSSSSPAGRDASDCEATEAPADETSSSASQAAHQPSDEPTSIIAESPSISRPLSSNASSRRPVCTHMRLMRIYGPFKCLHCGRVPRLGWVWRCVQDFGDDLVGFNQGSDDDDFASILERRLRQESRRQPPAAPNISRPRTAPVLSASMSEHVSDPGSSDQPAVSPPALKAWMQKLADDKLYTPAQLMTIQKQRQRVLDCVSTSSRAREPTRLELKDATISDPTSSAASSHYMRRAQTTTSAQPSSPMRSCNLAPYWQAEPAQVPEVTDNPHQDRDDSPRRTRLSSSSLTPPTGTICTYQSCSSCRPSHRDRTWQCMDRAHYSSADGRIQIPNPSTDNRLLSDPRLILTASDKILHPEASPWDEAMRPSMEDDDLYDDDYGSGYDSSEISPDISSGVSLEGTPTSSQFEESHGWDHPSLSSSRLLRPLPTGFASAGRPLRKASSLDPKLLRSSRDIENMDFEALGVGMQGNAGAAIGAGAEAARGSGDEEPPIATVQELGAEASGEVIVQDGVAVTEEGVAAGVADMVMQT